MEKLPLAKTVNYWKTGKSAPGKFLDDAERQIEKMGGSVSMVAKGKQNGRTAFCIEFEVGGERFRIVWPVLRIESEKDMVAAERQAATLLYHDVKARGLRAALFGTRNAFFEFLLLPNGNTVGQLSTPELAEYSPKLLTS